jgi:hypothetical protein
MLTRHFVFPDPERQQAQFAGSLVRIRLAQSTAGVVEAIID